jgi:quinol monooxygenase YgiN
MFLTTVKLRGKSSKRKEIVQTLHELSDRMKGDDSCVKADLYQDIDNKDTLYFLEEWQTRKSMDKQNKSEFCAVLLGMDSLLVESLEIIRAEII